ncbi:helix-turn-helix domain-containing protein [Pseudonocardia alaniniphila]|uniref:Helix-turn-helix domain-containing protein n=1 Tax=Pseudonocardia alaniniphila TaxID=75291 RepID=A0ABS9T9U7_9PSEU|nr:helix-turn-helix domain-containing protein [Pseudonocardia alaniniphila]MCH6165307.1 helix-turn-helix domain-containing protein [Pseudonocardia alaniniphila]
MQIREFSGEEFEDVAREFLIPTIIRTGPDFRGRMASVELGGGLTLAQSRWGPRSAVRTGRMAARASEGDLRLLLVQVSGAVRMVQRDRFARLTAGMGLLSEACSPSKWAARSENQQLTLSFSRELLPLRSAEITEACARTMDPASPAMQTLSAYLGRLFRIADGLTAPQRMDAGHAAIDLLAMALRDVVPSVPGSDGSATVLLDMMLMHVREHLADPHLQVEELARRHNVSVSHVYTLFERIGTTPGAYLREQRLLAAQAMLLDQRYAWLDTTDIAAAVGFVEPRTFQRAFRRQYGMTPSTWRRERSRTGSAPAVLKEAMPPLRENTRPGYGRC